MRMRDYRDEVKFRVNRHVMVLRKWSAPNALVRVPWGRDRRDGAPMSISHQHVAQLCFKWEMREIGKIIATSPTWLNSKMSPGGYSK